MRFWTIVIYWMIHTGFAHAAEWDPCGESGTIAQRIQDCSKGYEAKIGDYILVSRTDDFKEVRLDIKTSLMWGDLLKYPRSYNEAKDLCDGDFSENGNISEVSWRLPTLKEFQDGWTRNLRLALRHSDYFFWTSTPLGPRAPLNFSNMIFNLGNGLTYHADHGIIRYSDNMYIYTRCVALMKKES